MSSIFGSFSVQFPFQKCEKIIIINIISEIQSNLEKLISNLKYTPLYRNFILKMLALHYSKPLGTTFYDFFRSASLAVTVSFATPTTSPVRWRCGTQSDVLSSHYTSILPTTGSCDTNVMRFRMDALLFYMIWFHDVLCDDLSTNNKNWTMISREESAM